MYNKKDKDKMWIIYLKLVGLKLKTNKIPHCRNDSKIQ